MTVAIFCLILLAALVNALWNFALRSTSGDMAVLWLSYVTGALVSVPVIAWRVATGTHIQPAAVAVMALSGCVHAVYMWSLAKAYRYGEISLVYPIARGTGVVGTAIAAILLLGQSMSAMGGAGVLTVIAGIAVLSVSHTDARMAVRSSAGALGVGCTTITYSIIDTAAVAGISWLGLKPVDPFVYVFGPIVVPAVFIIPYVLRHWRPQLRPALATKKSVILFSGLGGLASYMVVLWAFQKTHQTGYVMAIRESSVVFGSLLGLWLLRESLSWRKVIGLAAVAAGLVIVKLAA